MKKWLKRALLALAILLLLAQLVPYGHDHTNPPARNEPKWNAPRTRELAARACFDCHSNETRWPWYASVAPASWLVQRDVDEGRAALNLSEGARGEADEAAEMLAEGEMPPWFYLPLHPAARLSASEQRELVEGFVATLGGEAGAGEGAQGTGEDDD